MKQLYHLLCIATLVFSALPTLAQLKYEFKDAPGAGTNGLGPYTQNFDGLAGTKALFNSGSTLPGVYARFTLDNAGGEFESFQRNTGAQAKLTPNDGSEGPNASSVDADGTAHGAAWYHFGVNATDPDRALGGIASTTITPGKGYVGIRLRNSSSKTIVNLEIRYVMEQWYNSSKAQAASVTVDYKVNPGDMSGNFPYLSGTSGWTNIPNLNVAAPSTSTAIAPRNGNAATNRRLLQADLTNLNLAPDGEILIRWGYVFNSGTNGNGLSIDDVVITPQTNIFYSNTSGKLDNKNSWGTNTNGSGTSPANFTADNTVYYVMGTALADDRITGTWTLSGANSKVIVGTPSAPAALYVGPNDLIVGTVDVNAGSTLQIAQTNNNLSLGALDKTSVVEYINTTTTSQQIKPTTLTPYGNLKLSGNGPKNLAGNVLVTDQLVFSPTTANSTIPVSLGNFNLTLQKDVSITGLNGANTMFVTNGAGTLRRTVSNTGTDVLYPVGTSSTSYTPVFLQQPTGATALNEDVFSVRVIDGLYRRYTATEDSVAGTVVKTQNVKKTWLIAEEVAGNSNITMGLQWNASDQMAGTAATAFVAAQAYVSHYINGTTPYFDKPAAAASSVSGTRATRTGITSFSPFGVSSRVEGPLPVTLAAFTATRTPQAVRCDWKTASELKNAYFAVERSADGREFTGIGTVAGRGTTAQATTYSYLDRQPLNGLAYYRLRQTDLDGTYQYSPIVAVTGCTTCADVLQTLALAPNPGAGLFRVLDAGGQLVAVTGTVHNTLGKVVQQLNGHSTVDLQAQPAGIYLLKLDAAHGAKVLRVVKE